VGCVEIQKEHKTINMLNSVQDILLEGQQDFS
jgi:hypothetical protein